jgi:2-phosphoglycerate kinase
MTSCARLVSGALSPRLCASRWPAMRPLLVLVSGSPGSGKTTLARRLAADLVMPLLGKDTIKEALGDARVVDSVQRSQVLPLVECSIVSFVTGAR